MNEGWAGKAAPMVTEAIRPIAI